MARPIYRNAAAEPAQRDNRGHAGLWFDKFCNTWNDRDGWSMSAGGGNDSPKLKWIKGLAQSRVGDPEQLAEYAERLIRLVNGQRGRWAVFTAESPFVTGLGRSHPVENGFAWHPTLGAPFLPGSSVKGMTRAWAKAEGAEAADWPRLLGNAEHSGKIAFLDAVPTRPARLEADVMTPHYAGWRPDDPPGDWRSPVPIPFLVTAKGASFLFGIIPGGSVPADDVDAAWNWLLAALEWAGGGAKTAVGYGRFVGDGPQTAALQNRLDEQEIQQRAEQERQRLMATPEGRWRLELVGLAEREVLDLIRINLERDDGLDDPAARRMFAQAVLSEHGDKAELWRRQQKQNRSTSHGGRRLRKLAALLDDATAGSAS